jgi:hypothetical protein
MAGFILMAGRIVMHAPPVVVANLLVLARPGDRETIVGCRAAWSSRLNAGLRSGSLRDIRLH